MSKKKFDVTKIAFATGGGAIGQMIQNKVEEYAIEKGKPIDPKFSPFLLIGLGSAVQYFGGDKYEAIGLGMCGAAGSDYGDQILTSMSDSDEESGVQGLANRLNGKGDRMKLRNRIDLIRKRLQEAGMSRRPVERKVEDRGRDRYRDDYSGGDAMAYRPYGFAEC